MLRIGLTGGIGSGKSAVAARLATQGAVVVDADALAREVVAPGSQGLAALVEAFGSGILQGDGSLDRAALAERAFADDTARAVLNSTIHPLIGAETARRAAAAEADGAEVLVHDVPLLVENGLAPMYHLVVVVDAPVEQRLTRVLDRSGLDAEQVRARMAAQADDAARRAVADVWVDNSGSLAELHAAVDTLAQDRLLPYAENLRLRRRAPRAVRAVLSPPDPTWPEQAARTLARVGRVVGGRARAVEHIGSTAVPGLDAKDVLDVMVVVEDLPTARTVAADLLDAGLVAEQDYYDVLPDGTRVDKGFAGNADPGRAVNCHVRVEGAPNVADALLLRDWLRARPEVRDAYGTLKHELAARPHASIDDYADSKSEFIRAELARARAWDDAGRPDLPARHR